MAFDFNSSRQSSWLVLRNRQLSLRLSRRVPSVLLILTLITLVAMVWSVSQGEYPVPPLDVIRTIFGLSVENADYTFIVNTLRLPRTLVAVGVGMALAISGSITQGITRNPLAAPGIVGVNSGASLAAIILIVLFPNAPVAALPLGAFGGALTVALLIYLLAWKGGSAPLRLILVGVGFTLVTGAVQQILITFGNINDVGQALVWLAGSVYGRSWPQVIAFTPWLLVFGAMALLLSRELNTLQLGDDVARSIGSRLELQRGLLLLSSVALAGAAVATAGGIGFVGLMAPHIARQLVN